MATTPTFTQSLISGLPTANYTSLQFGPDGRLYVSEVDGTILALTLQATSTGYQVAPGGIQTINVIKSITNYNDDGTLAAAAFQGTRQVTGILLPPAPTPGSPVVMYVSSSDPRVGGGETGGDVNLDTNSGVISRLTQQPDGSWQRVDLVRGLPRSEENHSVNGMQLSADGKTLYLAVGGNTNKGAPSAQFAYLPEDAYSAAILSIDLTAIDAMPTQTDQFGNAYKYNLPTLPAASTDPFPNDPFGGQDGLSQAVIRPGSPVQIYSPGYRNPYDLVLTQSGKLYTIDNGANSGWGDLPAGVGTANVTNAPEDGGTNTFDSLHLVTLGSYGGHPDPIRANPSGAGWYLNSKMAMVANLPAGWPPVQTADPIEANFGAGNNTLYAGFQPSTDGLTEYTASTFGGAMEGNLLATGLDGQLYRIQLNTDGTQVVAVTKLTSASGVMGGGGFPLDVTARGDGQTFAGDIFVANYGGGITVFTPSAVAPPPPPPGGGDTDGDGIPDNVDRFAVDPANGTATTLAPGQTLTWGFSQNVAPPGPAGISNMGFTGLMSDNTTPYTSLYDAANIIPGGAAAGFQVKQVSAGDAIQNTQQNGFQFGVNVQPNVSRFVIETKIDNPFSGNPSATPVNFDSQGFYIGTGDQDNYLKIVASANNGAGGIQVASENAGVPSGAMYAAGITGPGAPSDITLRLAVDEVTGTVTPSWTYTAGGQLINGSGAPVQLSGDTLSALRGTYTVSGHPSDLAVGIISTSFGSGQSFPALWNYINITADPSVSPPPVSPPPVSPPPVSPPPVIAGGPPLPAPVHANDLTYSSTASGFNHFIDLSNFEASYSDLIQAFGGNQQAMQDWYNANEPNEKRIETFDGLDYIASYGDLINAFKSGGSMRQVQDLGATHFIANGLAEGRTTTFNGLDYIASYGDLMAAFGADNDAGAFHYIESGANEGRTTTFDGLDYIASYSDLIQAFGANEQAGAAHFITNGAKEGRSAGTFDGLSYIAQYTDLMKAFGANNDAGASHYITNGFSEGRSTSFDVAGYEAAHPDLQGRFATNDQFLTAYINTFTTTGHFLT